MATITFNQNRKSMLLWLHTENGCPTQCITGKSHRSAIQWLRDNGYIEFRSNIKGYYEWLVTPKGVEWLDAHMPMVDQPQPIDETTIIGEVSFYADGKAQDGTIVCGTDRFDYTVRGVNGKVYDEIQRGDIEPRLGDELYDLPFSDLGEPDDEDTKPIPALYVPQVGDRVEYTKLGSDETAIGTVIYADYPYVQIDCDMTLPISRHAKYIRKVDVPTLSNLIDAALDPDNTEAYAALKAYDFASVPLWCIEIEREDVNKLAWDLWHLAHQQNKNNQDSKVARRQCERAFSILSLLNQNIYSFHKGAGFNVEN